MLKFSRYLISRYNSCSTCFLHTFEPSQKIPNKKPKVVSANEAVSCIKSDNTVFINPIYAPPKLTEALKNRGLANEFSNVKVIHLLYLGGADYSIPKLQDIIRINALFLGQVDRGAINEGRGDYTPVMLSEVPKLFVNNIIKSNIALLYVSPADEFGYHSLGLSITTSREVIQNSDRVIAEVNPEIPRTTGTALVHESHFDYIVHNEHDSIIEIKPAETTDIEQKIGRLIAQNLVDDGATLQTGIGAMPDSVLTQLKEHKNLGFHTEMFSDGIIDLIENGNITNLHKKTDPGHIVATFIIGTKKLFKYVHNNPLISMKSCAYTNDENVISQNPKVTAINTCIEMDLTGQSASDSIGLKYFSGFGGQIDFLRGAARAKDGKAILAFPSQTNKGESKIVPFLKHGAGVMINRAHVHYVVTEYGIASLFGKSVRQRAYELINIAHPKYRETLEKAAFESLKCMPSKN